jgi:hypothetical protein
MGTMVEDGWDAKIGPLLRNAVHGLSVVVRVA